MTEVLGDLGDLGDPFQEVLNVLVNQLVEGLDLLLDLLLLEMLIRRPPISSCPDPNMTILMADGSYKKAGQLVVGDLDKTYHQPHLEKASKKCLVLASGGAE